MVASLLILPFHFIYPGVINEHLVDLLLEELADSTDGCLVPRCVNGKAELNACGTESFVLVLTFILRFAMEEFAE